MQYQHYLKLSCDRNHTRQTITEELKRFMREKEVSAYQHPLQSLRGRIKYQMLMLIDQRHAGNNSIALV